MSVIDEVKQKTDIASIVGQYVALKKAGRNLVGLCPFHGERNPSFFVYPEQQSWHCFGCNTGGDVFSFIMKKEGLDFGEALSLLAQQAGVTIPARAGRDEEKEEKERLYKINEAATRYFHNLLLNSSEGAKARNYFQGRGFTDKTASEFQLGYSSNKWDDLKKYLQEQGYTEDELVKAGLLVESESGRIFDRFRNKLMFPILDIKRHVIGFGARVLDDSQPKYVNSPQTPAFNKSSSLYGINLASAAIRQQDTAVIVEGYVDVITAHQNGFNNVVASMGTSVTEAQVSSLKRLTRNLVLALDADAAGEEAMLRGVSYENIIESEIRVAVLPQGKDPDDVVKEDADAWRRLLSEAPPIVDYTINIIAGKLDLDTARDKSRVVKELLPVIIAMNDKVRQAHYIQKLAQLVKVDERTIEAELSRLKPGPERKRVAVSAPEKATDTPRALLSNRLEEDYLALLLQHPELKTNTRAIPPEYFLNSENREVFITWNKIEDLAKLRDALDTTLHEHLDVIASRELPSNRLDERDADYRHRLEKRYYKKLAEEIGGILAVEAEEKGSGADVAKLDEIGIEYSLHLKELYDRENRKRLESRR
ncbi:MAG: DNA primase [Dehalococcoidales bacterium]|nr:DNA primase [Dehalococcoidales bacterium]